MQKRNNLKGRAHSCLKLQENKAAQWPLMSSTPTGGTSCHHLTAREDINENFRVSCRQANRPKSHTARLSTVQHSDWATLVWNSLASLPMSKQAWSSVHWRAGQSLWGGKGKTVFFFPTLPRIISCAGVLCEWSERMYHYDKCNPGHRIVWFVRDL